MRLMTMRTAREFALKHSHIGEAVLEWTRVIKRGKWASMAELRRDRPGAVAIDANTVVFKRLAGNQVRIIASIDWHYQTVYIRWVGTHAQYDSVDVNDYRY